MFGIEIGPIQAGRRQNPGHLRRAQLRKAATELNFALLKSLLYGIYAHVQIV